MKLVDALQIVYDLALQNSLDKYLETESELIEEAERQEVALEKVQNYIIYLWNSGESFQLEEEE